MDTIVLASGNKNKLREISQILAGRYKVISMAEAGVDIDPEETGSTFRENALIKAKAVFGVCGLPVIADDSGLEVDALGGLPGVRSARFAGEERSDEKNNEKLLRELNGKSDRGASFVCCMVYYDGRTEKCAEGRVKGVILDEKRGNGGFGYDPLFYCPEIGKTFGEATADEKNAVSHRARALEKLAAML